MLYRKFSRLSFLLILLLDQFICAAQWKQSQFIIGAFQGPDPIPAFIDGSMDTASFINQVKLAHQAGFNFCTGNTGYSTVPGIQNLRYNIYQQYGLQSLYLSPYFGPPIIGTPPVRSNNAFQFIIQLSPLSQKAVCGYNLIDEPPAGESDKVLAWVQHLKELDPDKLVFVNLYPVYAFNNDINQYNNYLRSYLDTTGSTRLDVACFDFYPFVGKSMRQLYFYNLGAVSQFAYNRPVWTYVLTTPHWSYPAPDKFMLDFMVYCPLAYGVKGILYFTYQTIGYAPGMNTLFGNAIIDSTGNPTPLYDGVKSVNYFIKQIAGPVIMNSWHLGTYHVSNSTWGQVIQSENIVNDSMPVLASINNENILAGIFQNLKDSQEYDLFLVNKANLYLQNVYVALKGNHVGQVSVARSGSDDEALNSFAYRLVAAQYDQASNETWFYLDFVPGEGEMLRINKVMNPNEKVIIPSQVRFKIYPNPTDGIINMEYSLPENTEAKIQIFDNSGRLIRTIQNTANLTRGDYHNIIDISGLTPGLYFLTIFTQLATVTEKIILMK